MEINSPKDPKRAVCLFFQAKYTQHIQGANHCAEQGRKRDRNALCPQGPHALVGVRRDDFKDANICSDNRFQDLENKCL